MATDTAASQRALSLLDAAFFMLESPERMANVGPLMILRPPASSRSPSAFVDHLMRGLARRPVTRCV